MRKCRRECFRGSANDGTRHATLLGDGAGAERTRKGKCRVSEKIKDNGECQNAVELPRVSNAVGREDVYKCRADYAASPCSACGCED